MAVDINFAKKKLNFAQNFNKLKMTLILPKTFDQSPFCLFPYEPLFMQINQANVAK